MQGWLHFIAIGTRLQRIISTPQISDNEIGLAFKGLTGRHHYKSEGIQCLLCTMKVKGSTPLYRYWRGSVGDHFYTTNPHEIATTTPRHKGRFGYVSKGIAGYCFPHAVAGTVPLYRYWQGKSILITSIQPMVERLEWPFMGTWDILTIALRVWLAILSLTIIDRISTSFTTINSAIYVTQRLHIAIIVYPH